MATVLHLDTLFRSKPKYFILLFKHICKSSILKEESNKYRCAEFPENLTSQVLLLLL